MAMGRQRHVTAKTLAWSSLGIVPLIGTGGLVGLASHRPLAGAVIAGAVAACGQALWLLGKSDWLRGRAS